MKQSIGQWLSSHQEKFRRGLPFHWGGGEIILAAILIFGILSLGSGMVGKWIDAAGDSGVLPVSLHSLSEADYSVDEILPSVPAIGLDIIRDLLGINSPPDTGGIPEIVAISTGTPTPTPTNFEFIPPTGTATNEGTAESTATDKPRSTATSNPRPTATSTNPPAFEATPTATWTENSPAATNTQIPTATSRKIATNTAIPTQPPPTATVPILPTSTPVPNPTNTPNPTPTPLPVSSPTPRPTRSSTLAVTPTAHYTPGVTGEPPVVP